MSIGCMFLDSSWIGVGGRLLTLLLVSVHSQGHLVVYFVIQNAGLDGSSLAWFKRDCLSFSSPSFPLNGFIDRPRQYRYSSSIPLLCLWSWQFGDNRLLKSHNFPLLGKSRYTFKVSWNVVVELFCKTKQYGTLKKGRKIQGKQCKHAAVFLGSNVSLTLKKAHRVGCLGWNQTGTGGPASCKLEEAFPDHEWPKPTLKRLQRETTWECETNSHLYIGCSIYTVVWIKFVNVFWNSGKAS